MHNKQLKNNIKENVNIPEERVVVDCDGYTVDKWHERSDINAGDTFDSYNNNDANTDNTGEEDTVVSQPAAEGLVNTHSLSQEWTFAVLIFIFLNKDSKLCGQMQKYLKYFSTSLM